MSLVSLTKFTRQDRVVKQKKVLLLSHSCRDQTRRRADTGDFKGSGKTASMDLDDFLNLENSFNFIRHFVRTRLVTQYIAVYSLQIVT